MASDSNPSVVVGHNVSFDRIRIGSQYRIEPSGTRFVDTMSLHVALSGMTSSQRIVKAGEKKLEQGAQPRWMQNTSKNGLADCYEFYCKPDASLSKDVRNSFVKLSLAELRQDIPNLLDYCAGDVAATLKLFQALLPKFLKAFPDPVTLSGMLTMSTSFLPTNNCWERLVEGAISMNPRFYF